MRLPFVSREQYDSLKSLFDAEREQFGTLQEKYDRLQQLVMERGLAPLPVEPSPVGLSPMELSQMSEKPEPSPVAEAIKEQAQGDPRLARYLWGRARDLKEDGMRDPDIAMELGKWVTSEDEGVRWQ